MLTANAKFKNDYLQYLGRAAIVALAIHFALFYLIPPFTFAPYELPEQFVFKTVPVESIIEIEKDPPEVITPALVPVVSEGPGEEEDILPFPKTMTPEIFKGQFSGAVNPEAATEYFVFDRSPVLIRSVRLEYPEIARLAGTEGDVLVKAIVGTDGKVISAVVIYSNVTKILEKAAVAAVLQFVFEPAFQGVVPVKASIAVPVTFRLH